MYLPLVEKKKEKAEETAAAAADGLSEFQVILSSGCLQPLLLLISLLDCVSILSLTWFATALQKKVFDILYKIADVPFLAPYKTKIIVSSGNIC